MGGLLSKYISEGLNDIGQSLQAAAVLWVFPVYIFILFAIGTYLFFLGRRLRIEQQQDIDLLLDEFPALYKRYGRTGFDIKQKKQSSGDITSDTDTDVSHENAEYKADADIEKDIEDVSITEIHEDDTNIEEQSEADAKLTSTSPREQQGIWQIAVHDAPLLIISVIVVTIIYAIISLVIERAIGGDPLSLLLQKAHVRVIPEPLSSFLLGPEEFFFPTVLYTILGGVLLIILPRQIYRIFNLDWIHVEPFSKRSKIARGTWRILGFVNYYRLDGSTKKWLLILIPIYVSFLIVSDIISIFYGLYLPPAFLAAAHLFPVVLPRMFAPVWGSKIDFSRVPMKAGRKIEIEKLPDFLSAGKYLGVNGIKQAVRFKETIHEKAVNAVSYLKMQLSERMKDGLEIYGRSDIEAFLCHALDNLVSKKLSLIVSGPRGSGREIIGILCAVETALRGGSTLILVRNAKQARILVRRINFFGEHYPAVQYLNVAYAGSEHLFEVKEAAEKLDIIVADLGTFDRIADHRDRLSIFWARMDLAMLLEIDEATPLVKAEVPFLIKRVASLTGRKPSEIPVMLSVLDGVREDQKTFNMLLNREFVELPLGYAGGFRIDIMTIGTMGRDSLTFQSDIDLITRFARGLADAGYETFYLSVGQGAEANPERLDMARWTTRAEGFAEEPVVISLVRLLPENFFNQISEIRELSRTCATGYHVCFMMSPRDGFEQWLYEHLKDFIKYRSDQVSPVLLPGIVNPIINRKQMLRMILEKKQPVESIAEHFGKGAVEDLLARVQSIKNRSADNTIEIFDDSVDGKCFIYRRDNRYDIPLTRTFEGVIDDPDHSEAPIEVKCTERGIRKFIDPQRQLSVLWPGKIFLLDGERVRVKGLPAKGVLNCHPEPDDLRTLKIRQILVLENRDIALASDHIFSEEGIGIYRSRMKIQEVILGYRTWRGRDLVEETLYGIEGQIHTDMEVEASVIFFPGLDQESAHLIAHVLKRYLRMVFQDTDDVLDVTHNCFKPFSRGVTENYYYDVTVIDNVPGGLGVCDLINPVLIRKIAALIVSMHEEGAEWYKIQECYYPRLGKFDHIPPNPVPDMDCTIAERVVEYFKKVVLTRAQDADNEPLDFGCNIWIEKNEIKEKGSKEEISDTMIRIKDPEFEEEKYLWSDPKSELMAKVYADVNRIGRPTREC